MNRKIKQIIAVLVISVSISIVPYIVKAQTGPSGDPDAPIDGGVSLLIAAGIGYGIKKNRENKNNKEKK